MFICIHTPRIPTYRQMVQQHCFDTIYMLVYHMNSNDLRYVLQAKAERDKLVEESHVLAKVGVHVLYVFMYVCMYVCMYVFVCM